MADLSIADVLERAADLIEPEGKWTQGDLGRRKDGSAVGPDYLSDAVCFCASGAIGRVSPDDGIWTAAYMVIDRLVGGNGTLPTWNDAPERTQAEVVAKLREAAALAREQGK